MFYVGDVQPCRVNKDWNGDSSSAARAPLPPLPHVHAGLACASAHPLTATVVGT